MQIKHFLATLILLSLAFAGCRSHKEAAGTQPADTNTIVTTQTDTTHSTPTRPTKPVNKPHYYTANFTCAAQGVTANGQLRLQKDSVIWICASKVVELGRAKFTPDSVIVYAKVMNRCFKGNYDDMYKRFRYKTTFKQLYHHVSAEDAEAQLTQLFSRFGIEADIKMEALKEVDKLTFPLVLPKNTRSF